MFSQYAALIKNLRGVVFGDFKVENVTETLNWLTKRFKYRNLGVPPSILQDTEDFFKGKLNGKPFVRLVYPFKSLERLVRFMVKNFNIDFRVVEALVLASTYVSPLMVMGKSILKSLEKICVDTVYSNVKLDNFGWKLHFRIVDYTVLDFYVWSTSHSKQLWKQEVSLEEFVKERKKKINKDKKRYWRLQKGEEKPLPLVFYLDLAQTIAKNIRNRRIREEFLKLPVGEVEAGLAIEAAIILP